jgi:uncharacterized phage-associated protein
MPAKLTAQDVADYFLSLPGESFANYKLQKLVYYAQGYHLALFGKPLFDDPMVAGEHGAYVESLMDKYMAFKGPLAKPEKIDLGKYSEDVKNLLNSIVAEYGQLTAGRLREKVYSEMPWINGSKRADTSVSNEDLITFFKTQLDGNKIKKQV